MKHGEWILGRLGFRYQYVPGMWPSLVEPELYFYKYKVPYRFRYDPVPSVHKYSNGKWHRHPRTTQERRKFYDATDQGVNTRGSRRSHSLPSSWDDLNFAHRSKRSWKRQKKRRQWM